MRGLEELIPDFDAFFVDVWGVIHDGAEPFPGVLDALARIAATKKRVVFVTNTSRLGADVIATLEGMGIARALFHDVVTAGDVTRAALVARDPAIFGALPAAPRCFHFGAASYVPWLFELGLDFTEEVTEAELVFSTGAIANEDALAAARKKLAPAASRRRPLVCTNPDRVIPVKGALRLGPGAVADAYAAMGGPIFLYGKPHPPIYAAARRRVPGAARILALGDLLETDVVGAKAAGLPVAFIGSVASEASADAAVTPDYVLPAFAW